MTYTFVIHPAGTIFICVRHRSPTPLRKSIGYSIEDKAKQWDANKFRVKNNERASLINSRIIDWEKKVQDYIDDCGRYGQPPSLKEVKEILNGGSVKAGARKLTDVIQLYIDDIRESTKEGTPKRYEVLKNQIVAFEEQNGTVYINAVKKEFYKAMIQYLINDHDNCNKTIIRKCGIVRTCMRFATGSGMVKHIEWMWKPKLKDLKTSRRPLEKDEIEAFLNYRSVDMQEMEYVDGFVASIFTGLRYSDICELTETKIIQTNGQQYLDLLQHKTVGEDKVPLPDFICDRLKKYFKGHKRLFKWSEDSSLANKYIKNVAKRSGFDRQIEVRRLQGTKLTLEPKPLHEIISFHWARYCYINVLDTSGIQLTYIKDNVGHTDIKTTLGYLQSDMLERVRQTNEALKKWG